MSRLILTRLLSIPLVLLAVTAFTQALFLLVPGDPAVTLAGGADADPRVIEQIREDLDLDQPAPVAYAGWLGDAVQLDFGESIVTRYSVSEEIQRRLPVTLGLAAAALVVTIPLALAAGVTAAVRAGGLADRLLLASTSLGMAIPPFVVGMVLVVVIAVQLGGLPAVGYVPLTESPSDWARHIAMPAVALAIAPAARMARTLRGSLIDALHGPYVRAAWAKGGTPRAVLGKHALKNALMPTVTILGLQLEVLIGGSLIIENIFSLPGMGSYMADAVVESDLPVVQACTVLFAVVTVLVNLAVDVAYGLLNPRVRVS